MLARPDLPNADGLAVIGGTSITAVAQEMAKFVGRAVVQSGRILVSGGRRGAGEAAAQGAAEFCVEQGFDPSEWIFSLVPRNDAADFRIGSVAAAGNDKTESRILLVQNTAGAVVVGGGHGTADEVNIAALETIMNGYALIPAKGTGGVADRMCRGTRAFQEAILNDPSPSIMKATALVKRLLSPPCWYCDIDPTTAHDRWFFGDHIRDPIARRMYELRHRYF